MLSDKQSYNVANAHALVAAAVEIAARNLTRWLAHGASAFRFQ